MEIYCLKCRTKTETTELKSVVFTKLRPRLNQGYRGVNKLDEACLEHDIAYAASNEVKDRNKADDVLANKAAQLVMDNRTPDYEKQDGRLVTGIIATKSRFGM